MTYGSGATWAGTDDSDKSVVVDWLTGTSPVEFDIPSRSTATEAASQMVEAWNAAYPNEQVTQDGSTVRWPTRTRITNMSFKVDGGPSQEVPGLGDPVTVFSELTIQNVA